MRLKPTEGNVQAIRNSGDREGNPLGVHAPNIQHMPLPKPTRYIDKDGHVLDVADAPLGALEGKISKTDAVKLAKKRGVEESELRQEFETLETVEIQGNRVFYSLAEVEAVIARLEAQPFNG